MSEYHASAEALEQYSLRQLSPDRLDPVEEHLMVCEYCRSRLHEIDEYHAVVREALLRLRAEETPVFQWRRWIQPWHLAPLAMAAIALLVVVIPRPPSAVNPNSAAASASVEVSLESSRGLERVSVAPAGSALLLRADVSELDPHSAYRVQLTGESGSVLWSGEAAPAGHRLSVPVNRKLSPGVYWVRLYASDAPAVLLREYALRIGEGQ